VEHPRPDVISVDEVDIADGSVVRIKLVSVAGVHAVVQDPRYVVAMRNPEDPRMLWSQGQGHRSRPLSSGNLGISKVLPGSAKRHQHPPEKL
jgi:hypothetical protein